MRAGHLPRLALAPLPVRRAAPITQHRRLELLGQLLTDEDRPLRSRVAACLMLLFAQPATRIARLTIDDLTRTDDGQVFIRFGEPATPVPEPFATLLLQATTQRDNLQTATNPGARWLFPGRRAGQPLHASHLSQLVRDLGVPALAGRTAALRQLVLQVPAPVVAQALGYHHNTTTRVASEAGTPWSRYVNSS
jgi:integrase